MINKLTCDEIVAFQHSEEGTDVERDIRAGAVDRFQGDLYEIAEVVSDALRFAAILDDQVKAPNSDEARCVQKATRKLKELAETFQAASDRIQRARDEQKKAMSFEEAYDRWFALRHSKDADVKAAEVESLESFIAGHYTTNPKELSCKISIVLSNAEDRLSQTDCLQLNSAVLALHQAA